MAKRKRLWLARDGGRQPMYCLSDEPLEWDKERLEFIADDKQILEIFCRKKFESITGLHLAPGEIREVASITVKLVPKRKAVRK